MAGTTEDAKTREMGTDAYRTIDDYITNLGKGKGDTFYVKAEAGADKSPLEYLAKKAEELGYGVQKGLRADPAVKLLKIYGVNRENSILMAGYRRPDAEDVESDDDILTGMQSAVSNFIADSEKQDAKRKEIVSGDKRTILLKGDNLVLSVRYEAPYQSELLEEEAEALLDAIEKEQGKNIKTWNNRADDTEPIIKYLHDKLSEFGSNKKYSGKTEIEGIQYELDRRKEKTLERLERRSKEKPQVIIADLDDIDSTEIIEYVARNAPNSRFLLVRNYNTDSLAEGHSNPYVAKLEKDLAEKGFDKGIELIAPEDLEKILSEKFTGLNHATIKFLEYAAAAGKAADKRVVLAAVKQAGIEEGDRMEAASQLGAAQLMSRDWKPANAKIARKALENATPETYRIVAEAIENAHRDEKQYSAALADLYQKAGNKEKAVVFAKIAAEYALQNMNLNEAIRCYRIASENSSEQDKLDSLEKLVELTWASGKDPKQILTDAEYFENLALASENYEKAYVAVLQRAKVYNLLGEISKAHVTIKTAEELLQKLGKEENFDLEIVQGVAFITAGDKIAHKIGADSKEASDCYGQALNHYEKALSIAEKTGDKRGKFKALSNKANILRRLKKYEDAKQIYGKDLMNLAEQLNDMYSMVSVLDNLAVTYWYLNRFNDAGECVKRALNICENNGIIARKPSLYNTACATATELGDLESALKNGNNALHFSERVGIKSELLQAKKNIAEVYAKMINKILPSLDKDVSELVTKINQVNSLS